MGRTIDLNLYDNYVLKYRNLCINKEELIPRKDMRNYGLPDFKWFAKYNDDIRYFNDFVRLAGLIPNSKITKEDAINSINYMINKYGNDISYDDFRCPKLNEIGTGYLKKYFGSLNKMKTEFNLNVSKISMIDKSRSKDKMLDDFYKLYLKLGRVPTDRDLNRDKNCLNACTYCKYFGNVNNVREILRLKKNKSDKAIYKTNEDIISEYKEYFTKLGYVPMYETCCIDDDLVYPNTILRRLGLTWNEFVTLIGFTPNKSNYGNVCFADDGEKCLSQSERIIHNILIQYNCISIKKEGYYKDFLCDENLKKLSKTKRCDWIIIKNNEKYIIEYFGLMRNHNYKEKHDVKMNLINSDKNKNYVFIDLYPKDLSNIKEKLEEFEV